MQHEITIVNDKKKIFVDAMRLVYLAESSHVPFKINGYRIINKILYLSHYSDRPTTTKFPYPMDIEQAIEFAWGWVQNNEPSSEEPDTDGSVQKGFEIKSGMSYVLSEDWGLFVSVEPKWIVYGK